MYLLETLLAEHQ